MSIDSAVAFTLRDDNGADQTLWLGFGGIEKPQALLAEGLANDAETRAEAVANIVEVIFDSIPLTKGLSFAQPPGVTHTIHRFNFNEEIVELVNPDTGDVKAAMSFYTLKDRHGF